MMQQHQPHWSQAAGQPGHVHAHGQQATSPMLLQRFGSVASHLMGLFSEFEAARRMKEGEWLEDLEHYHGIYDTNTKANLANQPNRSKTFLELTKTKCLTAYARIIDIYFSNPLTDFWSIEPTPVPDLPVHVKRNLVAMAVQEVVRASGRPAHDPELREILKQRVAELQDKHALEWREKAQESAEAMTKEVRDIFAETHVEDEIKAAILECCIIGTGCFTDVMPASDERRSWQRDEQGQWILEANTKLSGKVERVSCFDVYPDPHCKTPKHLERLFHRRVMTRSQVENLRGQPGFFDDQITSLLMQSPAGNHTYKPHESYLNQIAGIQAIGNSGHYEVLIYWGMVPGHILQQSGFKADPTKSMNVCLFMCGGILLGARLNGNRRKPVPYNFIPYELTSGRFWGVGVSRSIRHTQMVLNSAIRLYIDNAAISSGPIVEVNTDLIAPEELTTAHQIFPWRVFKRSGDAASPAVRFYQPQTMSGQLNTLIDMMRRFADEVSNLPSYTHGQTIPGLNKTATGMSMLMNASNVALKSVVKNIDTYGIKPLVESARDHVMAYSSNELAKSGDIRERVNGSSTLMAKELQSQRLMQLLQMTNNPVDAPMMKRQQLIRDTAKSLDIDPDDVMLTEDEWEELQRRQSQQSQAQQGQSQGGQIQQGMGVANAA